MKRSGILHAELSGIVAAMGHGELLVIGDAGLPVPPGVPGFLETVTTVLSELVVERGLANAEQPLAAAAAAASLEAAWPAGVPLERVAHAELKRLSASARAVVRTGEATPYCNIVLVAGVPF